MFLQIPAGESDSMKTLKDVGRMIKRKYSGFIGKDREMRKVIFKVETSLDGFISGPNGEMDWAYPHTRTKENSQHVDDILDTVDTVLMSREDYQTFKDYWPAVATDETSPEGDKQFSNWLNKIPKVVFSQPLENLEWENARLVTGDVGMEIAILKQEPGKNLMMWSGAKFPQVLMQMGLIDEYWINVHPVALGRGRALFGGIEKRIPLKLIKSRVFESGVVGHCYQPAN
jgi:dihydrofolate reductase